MKGIDVIEAMGGIDADLIEQARRHERRIPPLLKWTSVAAVFLCAVILMALALSRLLGGPVGTNPDTPDILAPGTEDSAEPEAAETAEPQEADGAVPSGNAGAAVRVPMEDYLTGREADIFFEIFHELDRDSVLAYMRAHPEALANGWSGVDINGSGLQDSGTEMVTVHGDQVLAVNAVDGVTLIRVYLSDNRTRGVLAICKDTARLRLCAAETLGTAGQTAGTICEANGGVLAMTGSAFVDDGSGGQLSGLAVCGGTAYGAPMGGSGVKRLELRSDGRMYLVDSDDPVDSETRDACEFQPGLIIDGEVYHNEFWSSPNPRAVIGQSDRLEPMMIVTEGRLTDSLGCGVDDISDKLAEYGCVQALNLDGGSSAILYYKGAYVTRCSNTATPSGRALLTAWVYAAAEKDPAPTPEPAP